jgi:hypothetical protein
MAYGALDFGLTCNAEEYFCRNQNQELYFFMGMKPVVKL